MASTGDIPRDTTIAGRFLVGDLAGRGASGAVYRAQDLQTGGDVALKVIRADDTPEHFRREARVLEGLRHPAIVSYVAHGTTDDGRFYLALEWLQGETLAARLRRAPLGTAESVLLAGAVARALGHAHAAGIIHRDIKPSNLFLPGGGAGDVKVLDFGIARMAEGTRITRTGLLLGTPGYMAPEQARGAPVDARADLFSLGCVLYRCLSGVAPFAAEHVTATLAKVLFEEPAPLRTLRREVSPELEALVVRLLAKDPAGRPAGAEALLDELARVPGDLRPTSVPPAAASAPSLTMTERRFVTVVLARADGADAGVPVDVEISESLARDMTVRTDHPTLDQPPRSDRGPAAAGAQIVRLVDGTLAATFAGPMSVVDHAGQAARFALLLRRSLPEGRIVVATGRGVVDGRVPMGEVIDRAASMLDRAQGELDGVALDEPSARLLEGRFDIVTDGHEQVLLGDRRAPAAARTLLGKPSPHVGREREVAMFGGLLDECVAESTTRCAVLTGPAGLGKTRLVAEVLERARDRHPTLATWFARGDPISAGSSFGLASDLLRDAAGARRGQSLAARRTLLLGVLEQTAAPEPEAERIAAALAVLVGGDDDGLPGDPRSYGDRVRTAWEDLVRRVGETRPIVIVLDDLHWGDLASVRLVESAMRNLQDTPLCVLAVARPDVETRFPGLWDERAPLRVRLSDLTPRAARRLVHSVLGDAGESLVERIVERAAGNAFHLEELVRAAAEGRGGSLPETVLAMVSERLQSLDPEVRRLLRAASVFGETFWEQGVLSLLGEAEDASWSAWAGRLAELVRQELVVASTASQFAGDVEYRFRHGLVRDAAYATLTEADRVVGHRIAGEWLSAAGSADARALAEHFERGGAPERAASFSLRAAQQSLLGGDVASVLELCTRARRCDPATGAAELARLEAEAHLWRGEFTRAEERAEACLAASTTEDAAWWSAAATLVVSCLRREGWDRILAVYEAMRAAPFRPRVAPTRLFAASRVAVHLCAAGRFAEADELLGSIRGDVARLDDPDTATLGAVRVAEAMRALCAGDIAGCRGGMADAADLFGRAGDLRNVCITESNLGFCNAELGAYAEAEAVLRATVARARRLGIFAVEYSAMHNLGYALLRLGRVEEARAMERECVEMLEKQGDRRLAGGSRLYLALIALETGDLVEAEAEVARAMDLLAETPPVRAFALAVLARTRLGQGRVEEARAASAEASALLAELGAMEQGESLVRLAEAETLLATGDREGARRAVAVARDRLADRAAKMTDEVLRASFLECVPEHSRTRALADELGA